MDRVDALTHVTIRPTLCSQWERPGEKRALASGSLDRAKKNRGALAQNSKVRVKRGEGTETIRRESCFTTSKLR